MVHDRRYGPGERGLYDLYIPDRANARTPLVVFLYGGSWDSGSKDLYFFVGQSLASANIAVAIPDYRLYPDTVFPGFVKDAARAVATVHRALGEGQYLPEGDHPLFLMGHSAGAEIAGLVALDGSYLRAEGADPSKIAGFIGLAGPYDFLPLKEERYRRIFPAATRAQSQPINYVSRASPPMLLIAGTDDTTVDPANTRRLADKASAVGAKVEAALVPGQTHIGVLSALATALPFRDTSIRARILDFIGSRS
ncbi:alpha/beta hydrolase [Consotaella salsifontis]|uniref:alpha/beta hydrolase n=1 Tax=Consotaella salsifontis TaxID=1365950 RepID=UPI001FD94183|nr:alpha/beta hydrolase [Consotaella salsifontis]